MESKFLTYVNHGQGWVCDGRYNTLEAAYASLDHCCHNGGDGMIETNGMELYRPGSHSKTVTVRRQS